jgi:hypothetical protein
LFQGEKEISKWEHRGILKPNSDGRVWVCVCLKDDGQVENAKGTRGCAKPSKARNSLEQ